MERSLYWRELELQMLAEKVLYIPSYQILVLSDWHLGKLGHFRQEGIFVPRMRLQRELDRLGILLQERSVHKVVFLGDLFHSVWNREWDEFIEYIQEFPTVEFILTKGNHDILTDALLSESPLLVVDYLTIEKDLVLSHEPIPVSLGALNIVGHVHPGTEIYAKGRQRFKLPCFHLQDNILTLPAFGRWTGVCIIKKTVSNRLFPILGNEVLEIL